MMSSLPSLGSRLSQWVAGLRIGSIWLLFVRGSVWESPASRLGFSFVCDEGLILTVAIHWGNSESKENRRKLSPAPVSD
jgi:hypothetical protein